ncbi:hypothetical protein FOVG_16761 [Fusarium oxysporum f. sp. pisi HDV247]|uniref:Uncharacterized protein n=1 Tax=Fusarium oxysporum f. sp. pisi HDV247 TaxID=1080344 RepID=W9NH33_FUSOX|nr:hypothetical protein FOVG_16761 [Fusarium oxysporum f. sp. pisi HDV247]
MTQRCARGQRSLSVLLNINAAGGEASKAES